MLDFSRTKVEISIGVSHLWFIGLLYFLDTGAVLRAVSFISLGMVIYFCLWFFAVAMLTSSIDSAQLREEKLKRAYILTVMRVDIATIFLLYFAFNAMPLGILVATALVVYCLGKDLKETKAFYEARETQIKHALVARNFQENLEKVKAEKEQEEQKENAPKPPSVEEIRKTNEEYHKKLKESYDATETTILSSIYN